MNNLSIGIGKPHYVNRNQQYEKKEVQHSDKIKRQGSNPTIIKSNPIPQLSSKQDELTKVKQLKKWLLTILAQCKTNLEQELQSKRNAIMLMKKEHQDKLATIFKQIQQIRKKAYEQYKHICDKKDQCSSCYKRKMYFNQQVQNYLKTNIEKHSTFKQNKQKREILTERNGKDQKTQRLSAQSNLKSKRSSISNQNLNLGQKQSKENQLEKEGQRRRAPYSKFRTRQHQSTKRLLNKQQTINNQSSQTYKNEAQQKLKNKTRYYEKSTNQEYSLTKIDHTQSKIQHLQTKRNIPRNNSVRHSVLRQTMKPNQQQQQSQARNVLKLSNTDDSLIHMQNNNKTTKLSKFQQNHISMELQQTSKNSHLKRKGIMNRNNKFIKKNQINTNSIEIQLSQSADNKVVDTVKTSRDEIQELIKQQMVQRHEDKKISRYQRQRMFYHILKKELLRESKLQPNSIPQIPQIQELQEIYDYSTSSQNQYFLLQTSQTELASSSNLKKYSLKQRKQSLINKLAMLNQSNAFQSIKGKIDQIINKKSSYKAQVKQEKQEKGNLNNIVNVFLSEVLKISDLKRLTKEKFFRESVWSPQMRQMHQFCTYLEYSLEAFQTNLKKTAQSSWKQLSFDGKVAQSKIDDLILDNTMGNWMDIDLSNIGEENHREIQCSMKYYGIDIKRLNKFNQISSDLPNASFTNPISSVDQKSMKEIQQMKQNPSFRLQ